MVKPSIAIKIGTALLTDEDGIIDLNVIETISKDLVSLQQQYNVMLISSGAVGAGKKYLRHYKGSIIERKAAASIGNPILMQLYQNAFSKYSVFVSQALCERSHFSDRDRFLQLKSTFEYLWSQSVIPIVNENDLVSHVELKFSDNDELATIIAIALGAEKLVICTSAGGFLNADNQIIREIPNIDKHIFSLVKTEKTNVGLGGMLSKLTYTKLATLMGVNVIITGLDGKNPIIQAIQNTMGSNFVAKERNLKARQRWLASGAVTLGQLIIDDGAAAAIRKHKSLLSVGIRIADGDFLEGEVVKILDLNKQLLAIGKAKVSHENLNLSDKNQSMVVVHADDTVLLNWEE